MLVVFVLGPLGVVLLTFEFCFVLFPVLLRVLLCVRRPVFRTRIVPPRAAATTMMTIAEADVMAALFLAMAFLNRMRFYCFIYPKKGIVER